MRPDNHIAVAVSIHVSRRGNRIAEARVGLVDLLCPGFLVVQVDPRRPAVVDDNQVLRPYDHVAIAVPVHVPGGGHRKAARGIVVRQKLAGDQRVDRDGIACTADIDMDRELLLAQHEAARQRTARRIEGVEPCKAQRDRAVRRIEFERLAIVGKTGREVAVNRKDQFKPALVASFNGRWFLQGEALFEAARIVHIPFGEPWAAIFNAVLVDHAFGRRHRLHLSHGAVSRQRKAPAPRVRLARRHYDALRLEGEMQVVCQVVREIG